MFSQRVSRVSAVSEEKRRENMRERVAESSPGERNKIEAGGRVRQGISRVSAVSERGRKGNKRERVTESSQGE